MAQTTRSTLLFRVLVSLLLAASALADQRQQNIAGTITFSGGSGLKMRRYEYPPEEEVFYGSLARRGRRAQNASIPILGERAEPGEPGVDKYGKLCSVPGCFFCPPLELLELGDGQALLGQLTTARLRSFMRINSPADMNNKCVFYTSAQRKPPLYLSEGASRWACKHNKYSIWHLWPNKAMADEDSRYRDFYGIQDEDNWLHSILAIGEVNGVPAHIPYFENMSEAMAQTCSGEVAIMSQTPDDMGLYLNFPNIWKNKERPALMSLMRQGKISRFLVVDYDNQDDIWEFDIEKSERGKKIKPSEMVSKRGDLEDRASCLSAGLAQMPSFGDPFTEDYNSQR